MSLPEKFIIPEDRIPKPWSQGLYGCCVAASITKVLEVINYLKTGTYTMFSKFYVYGRHNWPGKTGDGMDYNYTLNSLLEKGTVPEEMCPIKDEMPDIVERLKALPNIEELDKEAEKTKIKGYTKFLSNAKFTNDVKQLLYDKQMPLVGDMTGKNHSTVVVGWDGNKFIYQNHNGKDKLYKGSFNEIYYIEGYLDEAIPELGDTESVKPEEPIALPEPTEIPDILAVLYSAGIITNVELWTKKCETDVNVYWLCRKAAKYVIEKGEKI
jgi:hypothetical protein